MLSKANKILAEWWLNWMVQHWESSERKAPYAQAAGTASVQEHLQGIEQQCTTWQQLSKASATGVA